jgi:hypothetical protein
VRAVFRDYGRTSAKQRRAEAAKRFLKFLGFSFTICGYCAMKPARKGAEVCGEECEHSSWRNEYLYGGER